MALEDDMPLCSTLPSFQEVLSTKWDDVLRLPWRPIEALPLSHWFTFYDESKSRTLRTGGSHPDSTTAFMAIPGLGAVTNMKLLDKKSKQLHQLFDYNHLLFTMQTRKGERDRGVMIEEEVVQRIKLLGQVNILRETLGVDTNDINRRSKLADQVEQELAQLRRGKKLAAATESASNEEEDDFSSDNDEEAE